MSSNSRKARRRKHQSFHRAQLKGIYLIEFESGVKIGITNGFPRRFIQYNQPWVQPIYNIWFLKTEKMQEIEKTIKEQYWIWRVDNNSPEYFEKIERDELINSINYLARKSDEEKNELELIYSTEDKNKYKIKIKG